MSYKVPDSTVIWIKVGKNQPIYLQPFIEEFSHRIAPAISKEKFGATATPVTTLAGLSENTYTLRVVLAAHDAKQAEENFYKSQDIKRIVNPDIDAIGHGSSVTFEVRTLSDGPINAQMIGCQETIDIAAGFIFSGANMFPKIIKLTMTFVQDAARLAREFQDPANAAPLTPALRAVAIAPAGEDDKPNKATGTTETIAKAKKNQDQQNALGGTKQYGAGSDLPDLTHPSRKGDRDRTITVPEPAPYTVLDALAAKREP